MHKELLIDQNNQKSRPKITKLDKLENDGIKSKKILVESFSEIKNKKEKIQIFLMN